jgi:hypothetical protein
MRTERHLEQAGEHDDRERHRHALLRVGGDQRGDDGGEDNGHGAGRLGDERRRAPEQRGEQPDQDGAVESRLGAGPGRDPERERHRQGDDGGGDTAEEVTAKIVETDLVEYAHALLQSHRL